MKAHEFVELYQLMEECVNERVKQKHENDHQVLLFFFFSYRA